MNNYLDEFTTTSVDLNVICRQCGLKLLDCKCGQTSNTTFFMKRV